MPILDEAFFNKSYDDNQGDYKPFKEMDSQSKNFTHKGSVPGMSIIVCNNLIFM